MWQEGYERFAGRLTAVLLRGWGLFLNTIRLGAPRTARPPPPPPYTPPCEEEEEEEEGGAGGGGGGGGGRGGGGRGAGGVVVVPPPLPRLTALPRQTQGQAQRCGGGGAWLQWPPPEREPCGGAGAEPSAMPLKPRRRLSESNGAAQGHALLQVLDLAVVLRVAVLLDLALALSSSSSCRSCNRNTWYSASWPLQQGLVVRLGGGLQQVVPQRLVLPGLDLTRVLELPLDLQLFGLQRRRSRRRGEKERR
ncbi:LOW QUALITY PROTEIN: hypothetical protein CRUP_013899, partial [Coryphaenoides rupestris]